ncbi:MAG: hypothetical protein JWM10_3467 [Myxococcaceae bacterium]|nr:hypothetical protein [Myxococcaceae bacterium]
MRLCLARHVRDGGPLGAALAAIVHALPEARFELYERQLAGAAPGSIPPDWCAATLAGGYRCRALGTVRVEQGPAFCADCAAAAVREGAGRLCEMMFVSVDPRTWCAAAYPIGCWGRTPPATREGHRAPQITARRHAGSGAAGARRAPPRGVPPAR